MAVAVVDFMAGMIGKEWTAEKASEVKQFPNNFTEEAAATNGKLTQTERLYHSLSKELGQDGQPSGCCDQLCL